MVWQEFVNKAQCLRPLLGLNNIKHNVYRYGQDDLQCKKHLHKYKICLFCLPGETPEHGHREGNV